MHLPDNQTIYYNFIESLSETQFKEFVQVLNKSKYNTNEVEITDGSYDGGNDLRVRKNDNDIRRNIQITTQKNSFDKKVLEDVEKSFKNIKRYGYLAQLDYYVNYRLSLEKQNYLAAKAEGEFGITLRFYDGVFLSNMVSEYSKLKTWLHNVHLVAFPGDNQSPLNLDNKTKVLYDAISMGAGAQEMKSSLISAYFLYYLYEKGPSTVSEVSDYLDGVFYGKIHRSYYTSLSGKLKASSLIDSLPDYKPKRFVLSDESRMHLDTVLSESDKEEKKIIVDCENLLSRYNVNLDIQALAHYLTELFDEYYRIDINELTAHEYSGESQLKKISARLIQYVEERTPDISQNCREDLVKEVLQVFTSNDLFNRNSVSKMFLTLFHDNKLDEYLSRQGRNIVLDTQILLRLISILLFGDISVPDPSYDIVRSLFKSIKESNIPINSYTTWGYVKEAAIHVREAIRLERFLSLPGFIGLGKSKNIIFNYYNEVLLHEDIGSLSEYISNKLNVDISLSDKSLDAALFDSIYEVLNFSQIEPVSTSSIPDNETYQRQYDMALSEGHGNQKSISARHHDLKTFLFLSKLADDEGQTAYLITWDKSFYKVRDSFSKFKELNEWYIYSPQKFANTLSVINFKVDVNMLNNGVISIMSDINSGNEQPSVIDLLNSLFSGQQLNGIDFINAFKQMRQSLLAKEVDTEETSTIPIDEMLDKIVTHYKANDQSYEMFVDLLVSPDYASLIIDVFKENIDSYIISPGDTLQNMIEKIDGILNVFD